MEIAHQCSSAENSRLATNIAVENPNENMSNVLHSKSPPGRMPPLRLRVTAVEGRNLPDCDLKKPDARVSITANALTSSTTATTTLLPPTGPPLSTTRNDEIVVFHEPSAFSSPPAATSSSAITVTSEYQQCTYEPYWNFSKEFTIEDESETILFELFMRPPAASVTEALKAKGILPKTATALTAKELQAAAAKQIALMNKSRAATAEQGGGGDLTTSGRYSVRSISSSRPGGNGRGVHGHATPSSSAQSPVPSYKRLPSANPYVAGRGSAMPPSALKRSSNTIVVATAAQRGNAADNGGGAVRNSAESQMVKDGDAVRATMPADGEKSGEYSSAHSVNSDSDVKGPAAHVHTASVPIPAAAATTSPSTSVGVARLDASGEQQQRASLLPTRSRDNSNRPSLSTRLSGLLKRGSKVVEDGGANEDAPSDFVEDEWDPVVLCPDYFLGRTTVPVGCALQRKGWLVAAPSLSSQSDLTSAAAAAAAEGTCSASSQTSSSSLSFAASNFIVYDNWHRLTDCRKGGPELRIVVEVVDAEKEAMAVAMMVEAGSMTGAGDEDDHHAGQHCADKEGEGSNGVGQNENNPVNEIIKVEKTAAPAREEGLAAALCDPRASPAATTSPPAVAAAAAVGASKAPIIPSGWYFVKNCHNTFMCLSPARVLQTNTMGEWCRIYIEEAGRAGSGGLSPAAGGGGNSFIGVDASNSRSFFGSTNAAGSTGGGGGGGGGSGSTRVSPTSRAAATSNFDFTGGAGRKRNGVLYTLRSSANLGLLDAAHEKTKRAQQKSGGAFSNIKNVFGSKITNTNLVASANSKSQNTVAKRDSNLDNAAADHISHHFASLQPSPSSRKSKASPDSKQFHMALSDAEDPARVPNCLFEILPHPRHKGKWLIHSPFCRTNLVAEPGGWGAGYTSISGRASDWATFEIIRAPDAPLKVPPITEGTYLIETYMKTYVFGKKGKVTHRKGCDDSVKIRLRREVSEGGGSNPPDEVFSFKTAFGNYLCYEHGRVEARAPKNDRVGAWEKFEIIPHPTLPDRFAIYSASFKTFLSIRSHEEMSKIRNSDQINDDREAFAFIKVDGPLD